MENDEMRVLLRGVENIVDILAAAVKVHLIGLHDFILESNQGRDVIFVPTLQEAIDRLKR